MLGWLTKNVKAAGEKVAQNLATRHAEAVALDELKADIDKRFKGQVFMVPDEAFDLKWTDFERKFLDEEDWPRWRRILNRFPTFPRTNKEAAQNEERYWLNLAKRCSERDDSDNLCLISRARIFNTYEHEERWLLREYYAATGRVIDPYIEEYLRLCLEEARASRTFWGDPNSRVAQELRNERERVRQELKNYSNRGRKEHFDKWGNWFVSHVEDAFGRLEKPLSESPANSHGEGGFASPRDIQNLRNTAAHRPSAQTQRFDD